jgi:hypothetical protein
MLLHKASVGARPVVSGKQAAAQSPLSHRSFPAQPSDGQPTPSALLSSGQEVDEVTNEMGPGPEYGEHVSRALRERGWTLFEVARFARLPVDAQLIGMILIDQDDDLGARELMGFLEEGVERKRNRGK